MSTPLVEQAILVPSTEYSMVNPGQVATRFALFTPEGTRLVIPTQAAAVPNLTTADGSDPGTTQTLANATKAKLNALLTALRTAGVIAP